MQEYRRRLFDSSLDRASTSPEQYPLSMYVHPERIAPLVFPIKQWRSCIIVRRELVLEEEIIDETSVLPIKVLICILVALENATDPDLQ